ncbi:MAG: hybrid sensor histidine kinase/response regulator, partial [Proteobacteria bacterium]|nr:hybrid sensor histidine kinase/response regulator [Pseudomonadota bacterium]
ATLVPEFGANPSVVKSVLGVTRDISEIERHERALEAHDRQKDQMLATVAHELRNPLAPIQNALYVMKVSSNATLRRDAEQTIESQLKHMVHLVDDLMDVSRITQGKIELRKEPMLLREALMHALETAQPLIRQRGHELIVNLPDSDVWLQADFSRISQIFSNLLTNAAKYTNDQGRITLNSQVEDGAVVVSVSDNGIGIPPAMMQRIFDIFLQVDSSLERTQGGLGIGLSLAKNLVEMHGGTISVASAGPGCGSEFQVRLPRAELPANVQKEPEMDQKPENMSLKVLVVDDSEASAKTLGWMLESFGCEVSVAHNGKDALECAKILRPNVVLLDIGLPGMSGYEVCKLLKADPRNKDAIFVAQTGWGQAEHRAKSQSVGFDYHLVKPVDIGALQNIMNTLRDKTGKPALQHV